MSTVFNPPFKIGDIVLYRDGTARARRHMVLGFSDAAVVILESQDKRGIQIPVKLEEVRTVQVPDSSAKAKEHRRKKGSGGRIWLIYVPQGGQPK